MNKCPCGSNNAYAQCCEPIIKGKCVANTAEQLMCSRYSAYAKQEITYLRTSLEPRHQVDFDEAAVSRWVRDIVWDKLQIVRTVDGTAQDTAGQVEFIAWYSENGNKKILHELSYFKKIDGIWFYVRGEMPHKIGRNDSCRCGSGIKFKKCCGK